MNPNKQDSMNEHSQQPGDSTRPRFGDLATDALRYWEPRRLIYNAALLVVVVVHLSVFWPGSKALVSPDGLLRFFALAVLANIAYCAAYAIDLFLQFSALRARWERWRWAVLAMGTAFGAVIAHFMMMGLLHGSAH